MTKAFITLYLFFIYNKVIIMIIKYDNKLLKKQYPFHKWVINVIFERNDKKKILKMCKCH